MKTLEKFYKEKEIDQAVDSFGNEWILSYPIHEVSVIAKMWGVVNYPHFSGAAPKNCVAREAASLLFKRAEELS